MLGAIIGDIVGSPYELDQNVIKTTDFPLFKDASVFTDDTVMTLAVAEGMMNGYNNPKKTIFEIINSMQKWGLKYPNAGYGSSFINWLYSKNPKPYNSYGNGAAMRVSSVAWLYDTLEKAEKYAELSAIVSHNHAEGIKGAKAVASAIFLARQGRRKNEIKNYITLNYGYKFNKTCDEIRPFYCRTETCQETVPQAVTAFLDGNSFEEVIRLAVSLGGDSDTLAAIAGSIAEAYYGIPNNIRKQAYEKLDDNINKLLERFYSFLQNIK